MKKTIKVWHVRATRKAAEILAIPEADITREMYALFESEVYPIFKTEDIEIKEDWGRALRQKLTAPPVSNVGDKLNG